MPVPGSETTVRLTREPLGPEPPLPPDPRCGGTVTFVGTVRAMNRGRRVRALQYEAYEPMARAVIGQIVDEARQRFDLGAISVHHRLGRLVPGDVAVTILVGAAHREAAFGGCRFLIDELKRRAPIWKKEAYDDGEAWIDGGGTGPEGGAHG